MRVDDDFTLRDTLARWWRWFGGRRIVTVVLGVPGAALLAWWLLRVPPTAVEATLPFSDAVVLPVPSSMQSSPDSTSPESDRSFPLTGVVQPVIYVHVVGAVVVPGVYALPVGSRGDDAVRAAGGALAGADLARVNLAAPLTDAVQVFIPQRGEPRRPPATTAVPVIPSAAPGGGQESVASSGATDEPATSGRVRLNVAEVKELDALPGIGPATAAAIVDHRRRNGPFRTLDDLDAVNGIGPARIAALRDLVVVD
jgi:competence protein ComEA